MDECVVLRVVERVCACGCGRRTWRRLALAAVTAYNFKAATALHQTLTTTSWADNKDWLKGLKHLLSIAQKKYVR